MRLETEMPIMQKFARSSEADIKKSYSLDLEV